MVSVSRGVCFAVVAAHASSSRSRRSQHAICSSFRALNFSTSSSLGFFFKKIQNSFRKLCFILLIYSFIWFGFLGGRFVCIFLSSLPGGIVSALRAWGPGSTFFWQ